MTKAVSTEVAAVVFLPKGFTRPYRHTTNGVGAMKAVGGFEEGGNAFHTRQAFLAGDDPGRCLPAPP